jgi:hypothetical protein
MTKEEFFKEHQNNEELIKELDNIISVLKNCNDQIPGWVRDQFNIALSEWCSETGINFGKGSTQFKYPTGCCRWHKPSFI